MTAYCKNCGESTDGEGDLRVFAALGGALIWCPVCGTCEFGSNPPHVPRRHYPKSLFAEALRQKKESIDALEEKLRELRRRDPIAYYEALEFKPGDPCWSNAVSVTNGRHDGRIVLRPYWTKSPGAWRVEAASAEWYVSEEHVFTRWEGHACRCDRCMKVARAQGAFELEEEKVESRDDVITVEAERERIAKLVLAYRSGNADSLDTVLERIAENIRTNRVPK